MVGHTAHGHGAPPSNVTPAAAVALTQAVEDAVNRLDDVSDYDQRHALIERAQRDTSDCFARAPHSGACQYADALLLGADAQEHPLHFRSYVKQMLEALARADAADPNYDFAGPERVRALVLLRAPGWPIGPGNSKAGLVAAQRAVTLQPDYPANWLALAEAQTKTGARVDARASYDRARRIAERLPPSRDRDDWLRDAAKGLGR